MRCGAGIAAFRNPTLDNFWVNAVVIGDFPGQLAPELALAQAASPFESGATNLVTSLTTLATPIAVLLVMALGVAAAAGRISWGWPIGVLVGIGLVGTMGEIGMFAQRLPPRPAVLPKNPIAGTVLRVW